MYRSIDTDTWADPWFSELDAPSKLVFLYLLSNHHVDAAGMCEVTLRVMAFETGLTQERLAALLPGLAPRVLWWQEHNLVWVRNFYRRQSANTNRDNFCKSASRAVAQAPEIARAQIVAQYPELSEPAPLPPPKKKEEAPSHGDASSNPNTHPDGSRESVHASVSHRNGITKPSPSHANPIRNSNSTETERKQDRTETHIARSGEPRVVMDYPERFERVYGAYPKKANKKDALAVWNTIRPNDALVAAMLVAIERQKGGRKWQEGYVPGFDRWLKGQHWEDEPEAPPAPKPTRGEERIERIKENGADVLATIKEMEARKHAPGDVLPRNSLAGGPLSAGRAEGDTGIVVDFPRRSFG